jgi:hypothetical protein
VEWVHLTRDRVQWRHLVDTVVNVRGPLKVENLLIRLVTISFSRRNLLHIVFIIS